MNVRSCFWPCAATSPPHLLAPGSLIWHIAQLPLSTSPLNSAFQLILQRQVTSTRAPITGNVECSRALWVPICPAGNPVADASAPSREWRPHWRTQGWGRTPGHHGVPPRCTQGPAATAGCMHTRMHSASRQCQPRCPCKHAVPEPPLTAAPSSSPHTTVACSRAHWGLNNAPVKWILFLF